MCVLFFHARTICIWVSGLLLFWNKKQQQNEQPKILRYQMTWTSLLPSSKLLVPS